MKATAVSRTVNKTGIGKINTLTLNLIFIKKFPRRDINKCPAIKLAVNRTHNVMGRIIFLTSSISTINIINAEGVPWGTRCVNIWFVFFVHPNIISPNQNVKERGRVVVK